MHRKGIESNIEHAPQYSLGLSALDIIMGCNVACHSSHHYTPFEIVFKQLPMFPALGQSVPHFLSV